MVIAVPFAACEDDKVELVPIEGGPGERYARAAVFLATCTAPSDQFAWTQYVSLELGKIYSDLLYPRPPSKRARTTAMVGCFELATNGCAALFDCFGESFEAADRAEPCFPACEGQVFTRCETYEVDHLYYRRRTDCERLGMACSDEGCVAPTEPDPSPCEEGTKYPRCEGAVPVDCKGGFEARDPACEGGLACAIVGTSGYESASCQGAEGACEDNSNSSILNTNDGFRCRGAVSDVCINGGALSVDCAHLGEGFTCFEGNAGEACGLSTECIFYNEGARCDGTKLLFCNAGVLQAIDCAALGFSGCDAGRGRCSPGFHDL
jgi:hypothetical protein